MVDFPDNYTILVRGSPGSGKYDFALSMTKKYLQEGYKTVFITTERSPKEIEEKLTEFGVSKHLGNLYFMDGSLWSKEDRQKWLLEGNKKVINVQREAPFRVVLELSQGLEELGSSVKIIFDSLSSFLFRSDTEDALRSFTKINSLMKEKFGFAIYTIHEDLHSPKVYSELESLTDGVIEMRYVDQGGAIMRQVRIKFLKGLNFVPVWKNIELGTGDLKIF